MEQLRCHGLIVFDHSIIMALYQPQHPASLPSPAVFLLEMLEEELQSNTHRLHQQSLRSYLHKEHTKVSKKKSGSATSEVYKSSWFGYTSMLFILDGDTQRSGTETELAEYDSQENTSENERNRKIEVLEHETTSSSTTQQGLDFATPSSKRKRQKKSAQVDEAYHFLTEAKEKLTKQDRFSYFGERNCKV
ncbi:unnamed protein product [Acanthoscelides obtectus]|uniref:Uncharacterized protein n=1 Tax=Acanthoscelides obtectus TaxID=200917 RepID=A0A9P0P9H5_ACAOB|nr:unnamed protein product [Acanthoscelides obtectus]CAK1685793.1 hypothetical protein AOBTE_LOCUS35621 [Acanthoscelides obtectus]